VVDAVVEALWAKVLASWDDEAAHRGFVSHCQATHQLAEAARLYRTQVSPEGPERDEPGRQADARKRLAAIALVAVATLDAARGARAEPREAPVSIRAVGVIVFVGLVTALFWLLSKL
jgi:hypothetical protein